MRRCRGGIFYNADGEMLIVPQQGKLGIHTELGILDVAPGEICVMPRGMKFRVEIGGAVAGIHLRKLRADVPAAGAGSDRREWAGESARFSDAGGGV